MPLSGDVRVVQDGLVPSARTLTNAVALDTAIVDANGDQLTGFDPSKPATSTLTQVAASTTSVTLFAANTARRQIMITNTSNKDLFVAYAATASATAYTVKIPANGFFQDHASVYTGLISGIWVNTSGDAQLTEVE